MSCPRCDASPCDCDTFPRVSEGHSDAGTHAHTLEARILAHLKDERSPVARELRGKDVVLIVVDTAKNPPRQDTVYATADLTLSREMRADRLARTLAGGIGSLVRASPELLPRVVSYLQHFLVGR